MKKPTKSWNKQVFSKYYYIYGIHPSVAALKNPKRKVKEIICTTANFEKYRDLIVSHPYKILEPGKIDEFLPEHSVHQGLAIKVEPLPNYNIEDIEDEAPNICLAILDQISDPHNIGAIIRSAAAFGVSAIILTDDNSPPENAIIAKSASGGLELVRVIRITNLSAAIKTLKKKGFWIIGLDSNTDKSFNSDIVTGKVAIALGAEGKGLRRLTKENCDFLAKIDMSNNTESLNVSNAAAIVFYETYKTVRMK